MDSRFRWNDEQEGENRVGGLAPIASARPRHTLAQTTEQPRAHARPIVDMQQ